MTLLSIGEFARLSRLSAKALRRYDELGLLVPQRVDPDSGYRWYARPARAGPPDRRAAPAIGVPLAEIRPLLGLDRAAVAQRVTGLVGRRRGRARRPPGPGRLPRRSAEREGNSHVRGRHPRRARARLLCLKRNVDEAGAWALGKEFVAIMQSRPLPRAPGDRPAGRSPSTTGRSARTATARSSGAGRSRRTRRRRSPAQYPELTLRTEPAHAEAYVHLGDPRGLAAPVAAGHGGAVRLGRAERPGGQRPGHPDYLPVPAARALPSPGPTATTPSRWADPGRSRTVPAGAAAVRGGPGGRRRLRPGPRR